RERDQLKSGILATAATTAAILGVTGASITSMTVVAQAFGLGAAATDLIAGTYLSNLPPATTQGFVKEMQLPNREGAALKRTEINTPTAAYHVIQSYLALCLPPTIEAKIGEHIATTRAFPDLPRAGAPGWQVDRTAVQAQRHSAAGHCRHDREWPDPGGAWRGALAADRSGAMDLRGIPHHNRQADAQPELSGAILSGTSARHPWDETPTTAAAGPEEAPVEEEGSTLTAH